MTTKAAKTKCECAVCEYGKVVRDLIHRTPGKQDKNLIEDLYDRLIHAEDDRDFHSIKNEGCDLKHGGISFTNACLALDAQRTSERTKP